MNATCPPEQLRTSLQRTADDIISTTKLAALMLRSECKHGNTRSECTYQLCAGRTYQPRFTATKGN